MMDSRGAGRQIDESSDEKADRFEQHAGPNASDRTAIEQ
jgi:hypothetical protein